MKKYIITTSKYVFAENDKAAVLKGFKMIADTNTKENCNCTLDSIKLAEYGETKEIEIEEVLTIKTKKYNENNCKRYNEG